MEYIFDMLYELLGITRHNCFLYDGFFLLLLWGNLYQMLNVSRQYLGYMLFNLFFRPIPSFYFKQGFNGFLRKAFSYWFCWNTAHNCIGGNFLEQLCVFQWQRRPNSNACHDNSLISNPDIIPNNDIAFVIPCLRNIFYI